MRVRVLGATLLACCAGAAPAAHAAPDSPVRAAVSLGDSYISGEAGRWNGNSNTQSGSRDGTDRAWTGSGYDVARVYGASGACHRSDVAEIHTAALAVDERINLSCSGATTTNVFRAAAGGSGQNGEAPQADQLAAVAASRDVELIVLSIGGNDLGFADIIADCAIAWTTSPSWWPRMCAAEQQAAVNGRMPTAMANVGKAIDEIRAVMAGAGFAASDYRLVLQSYPSPVPRGADARYPQSGWTRLTVGGCPFWNSDLDWARGSLVNQIADNLRAVAAGRGVQFLDLRDLMDGREVCARASSLVTSSTPPSPSGSEWMRFLVSGIGQGDLQESFHPNAYGQQALGRCLGLVAAQSGPAYACRNAPGAGPSAVTLTAAAATATARAARRVRPRAVAPSGVPDYPSRTEARGRR